MNSRPEVEPTDQEAFADSMRLLNALSQPILALDAGGHIRDVNNAAEHFFDMGRAMLQRSRLADIMPFGSPVLDLVEEAMAEQAPISGYKLDISTPRTGLGRLVDAFVSPLPRKRRRRRAYAARTVNCRKNGQTNDASRRGAIGHRARRDARP